MKKYLLALAWLAVAANSSVQAEGLLNSNNLYLGANVGVTHSLGGEDLCSDLLDCKQGKVLVGYKLNDTFAVEGAYQQFFNVKFADGTSQKMAGVGLSAVGSMPVMNNVDAFGRLGIFSGRIENSNSSQLVKGAYERTHVLWGVGAAYKLTENWGLRGEYEGTQGNGDAEDIGAVSGGITFSSF
jgi:opacity protein-like surface antigen